jgi:hypothetical protein
MKKFFFLLSLAALISLFQPAAFAQEPIEKVTASITAENTFTEAISPLTDSADKVRNDLGFLNAQVYGFGSATVTLQIAYDYGTAFLDLDSFTADSYFTIQDYEPGTSYRLGVKTGDYTSGTITCRISRGKP